MPRKAKAFYDKRAGCWASSAIGELKATKAGALYRKKVFNRELTHRVKDELAAQAWVHKILQEQAATLIPSGDLSFAQLTEFYLQDAEHELSADAYDRRVEQLDRFGKWPDADDPARMDMRPCSRITSADVKAYLAAMLEQKASASYVTEALLKSLKRLFNWAASVEPGRFPNLPLSHNPVARVKGPIVKRRATRKIDPRGVDQMLRWQLRRAVKMTGTKKRFAKIAVLLVWSLRETGARPKELCVGWWDDWRVEPDGWGVLKLPAWKQKTGKKTGKERIVPFPPHVTRRIERLRRLECRHPQHIFTRRRDRGSATEANRKASLAGDPFVWVDADRKRTGNTKSLQKWFNRLRGEAIKAKVPIGEDFRLYFHRSQFSTEAQRRGVPGAMLANMMGTSERMLDRNYTDLDEQDVLKTAKAIADGNPKLDGANPSAPDG